MNEAVDKERELVDELFILDDNNYNIAIGGGFGGEEKNGLTFRGNNHTEESKKKISDSCMGRKLSKETVEKITISNRTNEERKKKISKTLTGRTLSDDTKKKISESVKRNYHKRNYQMNDGKHPNSKPKKRVVCPHCGKDGSPNNMSRWHFDNCKLNK